MIENKRRDLVFWQYSMSMHQSALLRALSVYNVTLVVAGGVSKKRRLMGWKKPDFGGCKIIESPDNNMIERLINEKRGSVHIFSGINPSHSIRMAFAKAKKAPEIFTGVYSESPDSYGLKGAIRLLKFSAGYRLDRSGIDFVAAVGELGVRWFKKIGVPEEKVFQFGYFTEPPEKTFFPQEEKREEEVKLLFIGQHNRRKGIDLLLKALGALKGLPWSLFLIGDGRQREEYRSLARSLGLSQRVSFLGNMDNSKAMEKLVKSDLLLLPSRWDGWGAVINEALMRGVPAICSDSCGASVLLSGERGEVFRSGDINSLEKALNKWINRGPVSPGQRKSIMKWSQCLTGESAGSYLLSIIDHVAEKKERPKPPWHLG